MKNLAKKNWLKGSVLILIAATVVTACAKKYDPESDFEAKPMDGGKSVQITGYIGDKWTVSIPPRIRGLPVTHIGIRVFQDNKNITSVTIPNSVTKIEEKVFSGCESLASVTIPDSVTNIEKSAFSGCKSLASVTIPNSVTKIEESAFFGCESLASVTIPNIRETARFT
jgi:hypothetical protein